MRDRDRETDFDLDFERDFERDLDLERVMLESEPERDLCLVSSSLPLSLLGLELAGEAESLRLLARLLLLELLFSLASGVPFLTDSGDAERLLATSGSTAGSLVFADLFSTGVRPSSSSSGNKSMSIESEVATVLN